MKRLPGFLLLGIPEKLNSYLVGITAEICRKKDSDEGYLLDHILDVAGQKGTGKLTAEALWKRVIR